VVDPKTPCKDNETSTQPSEHSPNTGDMVEHLGIMFVDSQALPIPIDGDIKAHTKCYCLQEQKCPKFPMIQLSYTASHPEAVVVELSNTLLTVFAMLGAVRLFHAADHTELLRGEGHLSNVSQRLHFSHALISRPTRVGCEL